MPDLELDIQVKIGDTLAHLTVDGQRFLLQLGAHLKQPVTLLKLLNDLVDFAEPGRTIELDAPWDQLGKLSIDPSKLALSFDLRGDDKGVGFQIHDLNFRVPGLFALDKLDVFFRPKAKTPSGKARKRMDLSLFGTAFGRTFDDAHPLKWDLLRQPPPTPAPPGKPPILDVEYIGIGQHVALVDAPGTMDSIIQALQQKLLPAAEPPLTLPTSLAFRRDSNWLIGAKFSVLGTVTLAAVFNDPDVYGLVLSLAGERAKKLAGLRFEILYRKVSPDVGLYHFELKLPDAMRRFEVGAATLTLPIIDLDIYTDGSFLIDFGFPRNHDYSRSFTIEMIILGIPVLGAGGFYFGVLSPKATAVVPATTKGRFSPIIVFGIGFRIGLGKSIEKGILRAGFSLTIEGILEGVLAFFEPNLPTTPKDTYFKAAGSISLVGHLYGSIDFVVIKARIDVLVYASVQLIYEVYEPLIIVLEAGVSISVSIDVDLGLFQISVHFSFSATIRESFQIGSKGTPPWADTVPAPLLSLAEPEVLALAAPLPKTPLTLRFQPMVTLGGDAAVKPQLVAMLFMESAEFEGFARASLRAVLPAAGTSVNRGDLQGILGRLGGLTHEETKGFLRDQFTFTIAGPPATQPSADSITAFPMLPFLTLATNKGTPAVNVDLTAQTPCAESYLQSVSSLFAELPAQAGPVEATAPTSFPSMTACMFRDYVRIVQRGSIQAAIEGFTSDTQRRSVDDILAGTGRFAKVSGTGARFLMHGSRLPQPANLTGAFSPLYQLSGQQWTVPDGDIDDSYQITLSVKPVDGAPSITGSLQTSLSAANLAQIKAFRTLTANGGPAFDAQSRLFAMTQFPPYSVIPKRFALGKPVKKGTSEIYPLPVTIRSHIAASLAKHDAVASFALDLRLISAPLSTPDATVAQTTPVTGVWATRMDFQVRRVADQETGKLLASIYEISSTDLDGRADLQNLLNQLTSASVPDTQVTVELLYSKAEDEDGVRVDTSPDARIIKANLSASAQPSASAAAAASRTFLSLLREASAASGGGYYLLYRRDANDQEGLPAGLFEQSGTVVLTALVTVQSATARNFHNCVVCPAQPADKSLFIDPPIRQITGTDQTLASVASALGISVRELARANATSPKLFTAPATPRQLNTYTIQPGDDLLGIALGSGSSVNEAADAASAFPLAAGTQLVIDEEWVIRRASMQPGNAGFRVIARDPSTATDIQKRVQSQFSLLSFQISDTTGFRASRESMPASPSDGDNQDKTPPPGSPWIYQQILTIAPFAKSAGQTAQFSAAGSDPYRGLGTACRLLFHFQDLFGNRCLPAAQALPLDLSVAYRDALLGINEWPGAVATFAFDQSQSQARLRIRFNFDPSRYASGASFEEAQKRASADRDRFAMVFFQLAQTDVQFSASTALDGGPAHPLAKAPVLEFVRSAHRYLSAVLGIRRSGQADLASPPFTDAVAAGDTLAAIAARNGRTVQQLAAANQLVPGLFQTGKQIPVQSKTLVTVENDTISGLLVRLQTAGGSDTALTDLVSSLGAATGLLMAGRLLLIPPAVTELPPLNITAAFPGAIFPVTARVRIERTANIDPLFADDPGTHTADTDLQLGDEDGTATRQEFAQAFEAVFPGLKLAIGEESSGRLTAVQLRNGVVNYTINPSPAFFAVKPLLTTLWSDTDVPIQAYVPGSALKPAVNTSFRGIDLDRWAREFVADLDRALSAQFAPAIQQIPSSTALQALIDAKQKLAGAMSNGVETLLETPAGVTDSSSLAEAKESLRRRLLVRLSDAFSIDTIVQFPVTVTNPGALPLRLVVQPGFVQPAGSPAPAFTVSDAVVNLTTASSHLSFPFDTPTDPLLRSIRVNLKFQANSIEHESSGVLTFILPPQDTLANATEIPIPLRAYPVPPSVLSQSVDQPPQENPTFEQLKAYQYTYRFAFEPASQDAIFTGISKNVTGVGAPLATAGAGTSVQLPRSLAQYVSIAPALRRDLFSLTLANPADAAANAVEIFAVLATKIATDWQAWNEASHAVAVTQTFRVGETADANGVRTFVIEHAGVTQTGALPQFRREESGTDRDIFIQEFPGLNALRDQNVLGSVQVSRNHNLVAGRTTKPAFVYQVPDVRFANPLVPLFANRTRFDIGTLTAPAGLLQGSEPVLRQKLMTFFARLLEVGPASPASSGRFIRVGVSYEFALATAGSSAKTPVIEAVTPVLLKPKFLFNPQTDFGADGFCAKLAAGLQSWFDSNHPGPGAWLFDVSVYSTLNGSAAATTVQPLPLLELTNLRLQSSPT